MIGLFVCFLDSIYTNNFNWGGWLFCLFRITKMWEELQIKMDKLSEARFEKRKFHRRRR